MTKKVESELVVITKMKDLCSYVMEVTQKSPRQFRFSYVGRLQSLVLEAMSVTGGRYVFVTYT